MSKHKHRDNITNNNNGKPDRSQCPPSALQRAAPPCFVLGARCGGPRVVVGLEWELSLTPAPLADPGHAKFSHLHLLAQHEIPPCNAASYRLLVADRRQ